MHERQRIQPCSRQTVQPSDDSTGGTPFDRAGLQRGAHSKIKWNVKLQKACHYRFDNLIQVGIISRLSELTKDFLPE